jgi:hypothetical protein
LTSAGNVAVPPNILDANSTQSSVAVRENQNITLTCKADGFPTPKLMWRREDGQGISIERRKKGEHLHCNTKTPKQCRAPSVGERGVMARTLILKPQEVSNSSTSHCSVAESSKS